MAPPLERMTTRGSIKEAEEQRKQEARRVLESNPMFRALLDASALEQNRINSESGEVSRLLFLMLNRRRIS